MRRQFDNTAELYMTSLTPDQTCDSCGGVLVPDSLSINPLKGLPTMADQHFTPTGRRLGPRVPRPAERLFAFVRMSDRAPMACDLRFDAESSGWEVQFLERGELMESRRGFATRARAIQWAEDERKKMESGDI